jgi:hypothetical protein
MIQSNELRIGNWVEDYDSSHERFRVETIDKGENETAGMWFINGRWNEDVIPIPLTPELLEKCGFEIKMHTKGIRYIEVNSYLWLLIVGDEKIHLCLASAEWMHDLQARVTSLHQLQNLYFSLTNQELTIHL